jgi:DNA gyrase subunit A
MAIRVEETCIRPQGRSAHGVRIMKLRGDDEIVSMARVREGAALLTVTEKGFGKRTDIESYRIQNRGGFGITNYKPDEERGKVCGIKVVDETDDIMMISSDGIIIRIRTSDIRIMGRIAKGVRVMRVSDEGRVMAFTRTEHEDDAEITEVEQLSEEELKEQEAEAAAEESAEASQPEEPAEPDEAETEDADEDDSDAEPDDEDGEEDQHIVEEIDDEDSEDEEE